MSWKKKVNVGRRKEEGRKRVVYMGCGKLFYEIAWREKVGWLRIYFIFFSLLKKKGGG